MYDSKGSRRSDTEVSKTDAPVKSGGLVEEVDIISTALDPCFPRALVKEMITMANSYFPQGDCLLLCFP